jgi:hypothetical protein
LGEIGPLAIDLLAGLRAIENLDWTWNLLRETKKRQQKKRETGTKHGATTIKQANKQKEEETK